MCLDGFRVYVYICIFILYKCMCSHRLDMQIQNSVFMHCRLLILYICLVAPDLFCFQPISGSHMCSRYTFTQLISLNWNISGGLKNILSKKKHNLWKMHKPKLNVIFRIIYYSPNQYLEKIILQLKTSWLATFIRLNAPFFIRFCTTCTTYLSTLSNSQP